MEIRTIDWVNGRIKIIDQTALPHELRYIYIDNVRDLFEAIKIMRVRGAPALGVAAALGVFLALKNSRAKSFAVFLDELDKAASYLWSSRPTAVNLFWGLKRMRDSALGNRKKPISDIKSAILKQALDIMQEDMRICRSIGECGSSLIKHGDRILTICNAGALATVDYGTALGVIYAAQAKNKRPKVYACETRPLLQGSRLTAWELKRKGVDATLICDGTAASLMAQGKIDKVITGADRIARNGDAANKIGTYALAILAHYHRIPFYVAAPLSSFDLRLVTGEDIPIEQRDKSEVANLLGNKIAPAGVKVFNPAFDVTPHRFISAIITEKGIISRPFKNNIGRLIELAGPSS